MAQVESFTLNHDAVKAPYVRVAAKDVGPKGDKITKFDIRLCQPNQEAIPTDALHTLEHMGAAYIRDYLDNVIDLSPMGCRTGFYVSVWGEDVDTAQMAIVYSKVLNDIINSSWDDVQGTDRQSCGNYRDHSLEGAQEWAQKILDRGFSSDPFERKLVTVDFDR
ncbi:MAG: S-ribosylhomocysteine lyase [Aerococcus sp.]|nr:S-ribosylhomocysteine lyase [Aerococcus sp.]